MGIPLAVRGIEKIPAQGAVLVFNHSSYMDVFALAATLPGGACHRREARTGAANRRRTHVTPARHSLRRALRRVRQPDGCTKLTALAQQGRVLVFFPKAHLRGGPGCRAFTSAHSKLPPRPTFPFCRASSEGTRTVLRGDQWFPRHSPISVELGDPMLPKGVISIGRPVARPVRETILATMR